ncbi:hypothetical protein ARMSODRAFT_1015477 [Armillaria solidipes]|uniref:Uncharacterized protein n=1 Tax=Armillaria solidipes TaxID=1076256 RepID=A0A2H3BP26_9AGAR|nr:hypothetical protein ARMSODRAFT_1015477 [Armillaria solidipes]
MVDIRAFPEDCFTGDWTLENLKEHSVAYLKLGHHGITQTAQLRVRVVFDDGFLERHHPRNHAESHIPLRVSFRIQSFFGPSNSIDSPTFEPYKLYFCDEVITPWSMLLLEGHDDEDDLVRPYLGYGSDDYEEIGHALYGASLDHRILVFLFFAFHSQMCLQ